MTTTTHCGRRSAPSVNLSAKQRLSSDFAVHGNPMASVMPVTLAALFCFFDRAPAAQQQDLQRQPCAVSTDVSSRRVPRGLARSYRGRSFFDCFGVRPGREALAGRLPRVGADRLGRTPKLLFGFLHQFTAMGVAFMDRIIPGRAGLSQPPDSQPKSTIGNDSQQRSIPECIGALKEPVFVDMALIRMCRDELDAINLCIDLSRMSDEAICQYLGIDKGHWSRIRKGRAHFPTAKRLQLMYLAGNWAPIQFELDKSRLLERLQDHLRTNTRRDDGFNAWMGAQA